MKHQTVKDVADTLLKPHGLLEQAESAVTQALRANPKNPKFLWRLGEIYRGQGKLDKAAEIYQKLRAVS